jgi:amino acid permease
MIQSMKNMNAAAIAGALFSNLMAVLLWCPSHVALICVIQVFEKLAASKLAAMQKAAADNVGPKLEEVCRCDSKI